MCNYPRHFPSELWQHAVVYWHRVWVSEDVLTVYFVVQWPGALPRFMDQWAEFEGKIL